jgi:hypothetical protein
MEERITLRGSQLKSEDHQAGGKVSQAIGNQPHPRRGTPPIKPGQQPAQEGVPRVNSGDVPALLFRGPITSKIEE